MQEKLLECFVQAYYVQHIHENSNYIDDRHELFTKFLSDEFEVDVSYKQAKNIANSIAEHGVTICKSGDKVLKVLG